MEDERWSVVSRNESKPKFIFYELFVLHRSPQDRNIVLVCPSAPIFISSPNKYGFRLNLETEGELHTMLSVEFYRGPLPSR
jgi:hypothetical protein